jgi:DNA-binding NarL/FixJ family response regulator
MIGGSMLGTVLVCDQLPLVRDGITTLLDATPDLEVVGATSDLEEATVQARGLRPDALLLGTAKPGVGLELVRELAGKAGDERGGSTNCLVFYQEMTHEVIATLLQAGAKGLLSRDADSDEVLGAVRAVVRGRTVLSSEVAAELIHWFCDFGADPRSAVTPEIVGLTEREREVLTLMGQGMSIQEASASLYISVSTVRTHLHRIRHKLDLRDRAQLVAFAYQTGLVGEAA